MNLQTEIWVRKQCPPPQKNGPLLKLCLETDNDIFCFAILCWRNTTRRKENIAIQKRPRKIVLFEVLGEKSGFVKNCCLDE